ncbi:MAG: 2-hydroxyacid dehydrogenase [Bacillota bacterium]
MFKVTFFSSKQYDIEFFKKQLDAPENASYGFSFKFFEGRLSLDNVSLAKGSDAVCVFVNDRVDREIVDALYANGVRILALRCAGFNNVSLRAAQNKLKIVRVPAYSPYAVAEHALCLMLALNRHIHRAYNRTREGNFALGGLLGFDMNGKTCGIIGTGKIAKVLIKSLVGLGVKVLGYDVYPDEQAAKAIGFEYVTLPELYRDSDIISLHCPLTKETEYLVSAESISKMKPGVMLINTSRGQLVNTKDFVEGLKSGAIGAAGLDVYEEESDYFFEDCSDDVITDDVLSRLMTFPNVIVTAHQAFFTQEALTNIADTTMENIRCYIDGRPLVNEVLYTPK